MNNKGVEHGQHGYGTWTTKVWNMDTTGREQEQHGYGPWTARVWNIDNMGVDMDNMDSEHEQQG